MSANTVLLWMSARQEGSWQQYRAAFERLYAEEGEDDDAGAGEDNGLAPHQELRFNLTRLGHVEFISEQDAFKWRVAPPVLAVASQADGTWLGIVAGARSMPLVSEIRSTGLALEPEHHPACPDVHLLRSGDARSLILTAERLGMFVQRDAPAAILSSVSPLELATSSQSTTIPAGNNWTFERFSTTECRWLASSRAEASRATGQLFQLRAPHLKLTIFCSHGSARAVTPAVGKYIALRRARRHIMRYDAEARRLSVLAGCRPPELIERALTLCSGRPPAVEQVEARSVIHYDNITASIAATVGSLLHQEIRH